MSKFKICWYHQMVPGTKRPFCTWLKRNKSQILEAENEKKNWFSGSSCREKKKGK